jgi:hypothetical protein
MVGSKSLSPAASQHRRHRKREIVSARRDLIDTTSIPTMTADCNSRLFMREDKVIFELKSAMNTTEVPPRTTTQKLVTIYLDNSAYGKGKVLIGSYADKHGLVEDHLNDLLSEGWRVVTIRCFGGGSEGLSVRGWMTVLLEK